MAAFFEELRGLVGIIRINDSDGDSMRYGDDFHTAVVAHWAHADRRTCEIKAVDKPLGFSEAREIKRVVAELEIGTNRIITMRNGRMKTFRIKQAYG